MIVSHRHGIIFLKTRKTAGTSTEVFLSGICGAGDVVTPIYPGERGHTPRNHEGFFNHMPATEARVLLGEGVWNSYFKFCVERNPWDKVVSNYFWCRTGMDFGSFVRSRAAAVELNLDSRERAMMGCRELPVDNRIYMGPEGLLVDRVLRYEDLDAGLGEVMSMLGVEFHGLEPRAKSGFRGVSDYRGMYDGETRGIVEGLFSAEIGLMGYKF